MSNKFASATAFYTKTNGCDSYLLFHALPVFFIEYFHKLYIQRQMVVRWKHVSYFLYGKYLRNNSFIASPHGIKL